MNKHQNTVELQISGSYALFSDPIYRVGGEKFSYPVPTYEALKGMLMSVYWKPTIIWYIDKVRVMNRIRREPKGIRVPRYSEGGADLSCYTYLADVAYQVRAHFEWNMNRPEFEEDRIWQKHLDVARRSISKGGRYDVYLGTRECQADVEPCVFGEGSGFYDGSGKTDLGFMYHGITYADEAYSEETKNRMTVNFWFPKMTNGVIKFCRPEKCPLHKPGKTFTPIRVFGLGTNVKSVVDEDKEMAEDEEKEVNGN